MKRFWQWLLSVVSRKVAKDYARGENGWNEAIEKRRVTEAAKRIASFTEQYDAAFRPSQQYIAHKSKHGQGQSRQPG
jgi:cyclopropane fatty-acyl-phospholipid synthase-like methyltransferase